METDHKSTSQPGSKGSNPRAGEKSQPITRPASFEYDALSAIQAALSDIVSRQPLPDLLTSLVERAAKLLRATSGGLYLAEPEEKIVRCVVSYNTMEDFRGTVLAYGEGAAGLVAETGQPLKIDNYSTWPGRAKIYDKTQPFQAVISAPMLWQGKVNGVIHILRAKKFTKNDLDLLTLFASHAAVAVENARLYDSLERELAERKRADENLQQRLNEFTALYENGLVINRLRDPYEIGKQLMETLVQNLFWHHIAIRLKKTDSNELDLIAFHQPGLSDENRASVAARFKKLVHKSGQGLSGWAIQTGQIIRTSDVHSYPQYVETYPGICSGLYVPLKVGDRVIGCISVESEQEDVFTEQDERLLATLAAQAATSLENARLYQDIQQELAEREQAENALRESEAVYRRAIEVAGAVPYYQTYTGDGTSLIYEFIGEGIRQITGYGPDEFSAGLWDKLLLESRLVGELADLPFDDAIELVRSGKYPIWKCEHHIRARDGSLHWVFESAVELRDENGISHGSIGLFQDITERKRVEEDLLESKIRLLESQRVARIGHYVFDMASGMWTSSEIMDEIFGIDKDYVRNVDGWVRLVHPDQREEMLEYFSKHVLTGRQPFEREYKILRPNDQTIRWVQGLGRLEFSKEGELLRMFGTIQDITERKLAEEAQQASSEKLEILIRVSPLAIIALDAYDTVQLWNESAERMFGWSAREVIGQTIPIVPPSKRGEFSQLSQEVLRGTPITNWETVRQRKDGSLIDVSLSTALLYDDAHNVTGRMSIIADITQRKQTEKLQESIYKIARAPSTVQSLDELYAQIHKILLDLLPAQHFYIAFYDREKDLLSFPYFQDSYDVASPPHKPGRGLTEYVLRTREPLLANAEIMDALLRTDQVELVGADSIEWLGIPLIVHNEAIGVMTVQSYDETIHFSQQDVDVMSYVSTQVASAIERKRAEGALRESEERYRSLFTGMLDGVYRSTHDGRFVDVNPAMVHLFGYASKEEMLALDIKKDLYFAPEDRDSLFLDTGQEKVDVFRMRRKDGTEIWVEDHGHYVHDEQGNVVFHEGILRDVTERIRAEAEINRLLQESQQRLRQVEALHSIDLAIGSSMDLRTTLNILLSYVRSLLAVDAADILLFNSASQSFEFAAGHGYRSRAMESAMLPMGHSLAGKVALERRMLQFTEPPDLLTDRDFHNTWRNEGFASYTGIPLIAKGELKGILEVYHRTSFQPDNQWLDLLQNFSTQAAIALDNAQLFNDLQRSNFELSLAYDATIEGWSRALELRDYETSGHAQRITEWTLMLAHAMGMRDTDMVHIRRGALLHDIGKMGIPDSILLKPGPLTEEEWRIIRLHPVYAHEMLSSVAYLKSALEIPYCHHEKWDGTGYPRGLKGEEIPPAARIFAVLDIFDSLTTDRSYRKAWSTEKALEYIRSISGTHLDPKVVNVFLNMFVDGDFLR